MLREIGKIYSRSLRMIFQHPHFFRLAVAYYAFNYLFRFSVTAVKKVIPLWGILLVDWIDIVVVFVLMIGVPLALMLMVYQTETGIDRKEIFQKTKENFWKFFRQSLAGLLLSLGYTLPVFCLVLFSVFMDNTLFITIIIPIWILVNGYLSFGSVSLGQRILLDGGEGAFRNSLQGLRMLNGNFAFFISLYFINILISIFYFSLRIFIGTSITGVDIFAVPISSFSLFMKNYAAAMQTPVIYGYDIFFGAIQFAFFTVLHTFAYLYIKARPASHHIVPRKLTTEH